MNNKFRLVDSEWRKVLEQALLFDGTSLQIVCPFIKKKPVKRLLLAKTKDIKVITRFNLMDFFNGVSDIEALKMLLECGAQIRGIRSLHSKVYLFGTSRAIVTSANLTEAALSRNQEFGFVADDPEIISCCSDYISDLWSKAGPNLTMDRLEEWEQRVAACLARGGKTRRMKGLGDEGVDVGVTVPPGGTPPWVEDADQAFVKFFGISSLRAERSLPVMAEVKRAGCHWACSYPKNKRPRQVKDGALMFMARLAKEPNDIIIFGRAVAMAHVPGRDDATQPDIQLRDFKEKWPHYIRVHHPEFVAGTMANGVSLNELMETLEENAFAITQENAIYNRNRKGHEEPKNTDPRRAYMQQAAVRLSSEGLAWLNTQLEEAFSVHGRIPQVQLDELDWPEVPNS